MHFETPLEFLESRTYDEIKVGDSSSVLDVSPGVACSWMTTPSMGATSRSCPERPEPPPPPLEFFGRPYEDWAWGLLRVIVGVSGGRG